VAPALEVASAAWVRASDGLIKNDPATQTFTNTGALTLAGLDATATWGKGGRLEGGLAYSFVEAQDDTADEPLDFLARHRGHVYLATRPLRPLWTEVRLRVLGRRLDRGQWLPAHASLDLSASATWGGWLVTGQLTDALDARYDVRTGWPSAGRTVAATVTRRVVTARGRRALPPAILAESRPGAIRGNRGAATSVQLG
jgi:outer membrane cobalamin receptor